MGNLLVNWAVALLTTFVVGTNVSATAEPTPTPIATIPAKSIKVMILPEAPTESPERIAAFTKDGNPTPVSKNFNNDVGWKSEPSTTLKQAITNSLKSVKDLKKLCLSAEETICRSNPLNVANKDYGLTFSYQGKYIVTWYDSFTNPDQFYKAKTFIAEFSSLERLDSTATSIHSMNWPVIPAAQYQDLDLLSLDSFDYYPGYGQECVSSTCSNSSYFIKDNQVIGIDKTIKIAMNRYGGGTACVVIRSQAILLCNTDDWHTHELTQEAFWLK